jgi:hypothetical protein
MNSALTLFIGLYAFLGCATPNPNPSPVFFGPTQRSVSGKVTDPEGFGIPAVQIVANGVAVGRVTDRSGKFSFALAANWSGVVRAERPGYEFVPGDFLVNPSTPGEVRGLQFVGVSRPLRIRGRTVAGDASPVAGVRVVALSDADDASVEVATNESGEFTLPVPAGWSGIVQPEGMESLDFIPGEHVFDSLENDIGTADFTILPHGHGLLVVQARDVNDYAAPSIPMRLAGNAGGNGTDVQILSGTDGTIRAVLPIGWTGFLDTGPDHRLIGIAPLPIDVSQRYFEVPVTVAWNYHVAPSGNDQHAGTLEAPFRSVQRAADQAKAGDTIRLREGVYDLSIDPGYRHNVIAFRRSGAPGLPITLEAMTGESVVLRTRESKPVFDFSATWGNPTGGFGHYVFRGLRITAGRYGWLFRPPVPAEWQPGVDSLEELLATQIHDVLIEDCEVDGTDGVEAGIYVRYGGIRNLTVRGSRFHHTIGTEGTVDIGEWTDSHPAHGIPRSASRGLRFEDCDFFNSQHQQSSGIVMQPCVHDVTFSRCRAWNNGKYGFACKGSGGFRLDRCAAWGNDSTQMYCRGFGGDSGAERPAFLNDFLITNSVFIAPADQRGGGAVNWRENAVLRLYHCTLVGLRDPAFGEAGGYAFQIGHHPMIPCSTEIRNSIIVGYNASPAMRFFASGTTSYLMNVRYEAGTNLFFSGASTRFKYQARNWSTLADWQAYWATGEPGGNDADRGPSATYADVTSVFAEPLFAGVEPAVAPLRRQWAEDFLGCGMDVRPRDDSPAVGLGENLSSLGIAELAVDYAGWPRSTSGAWTAGAFEPVP